MKIGIMITPSHTVPPRERTILAPWRLVSELADGLVATGRHTVYLFAAHDSQTQAHLYDFGIGPTAEERSWDSYEAYQKKKHEDTAVLFEKMVSIVRKEGIEIVHLHQAVMMDQLISRVPDVRFMITLHNPLIGEERAAVVRLANLGNCSFVSISNAQRNGLSLPFVATVYHGIDAQAYPFGDSPSRKLITVGRIMPEKGQADSLAVAKRVSIGLDVVGDLEVGSQAAKDYWDQEIRPSLDGQTYRHIPFVSQKKLVSYYQDGMAMVLPFHWEEPFGLVMLESLSCGTPVVAYARGSAPEIIQDGVTGFLVNPSDGAIGGSWIIRKTGIDGLVEAVERIDAMAEEDYHKMRRRSRKHVEDHFTIENMIDGYEGVYKKLTSI